MKVEEIFSYKELEERVNRADKLFLLLYKKGSDISDCSHENLLKASEGAEGFSVLTADVTNVRDIHIEYDVTTVPALLAFEKGQYKNVVKGCNKFEFYQSLFEDNIYSSTGEKGEKKQKRVIVYTTPTCSWCTTIKSYLKKNSIRFNEIDVSKNEAKAHEMQQKSGQMGVPQTEINGQMVVGFDKNKINRLLEIE